MRNRQKLIVVFLRLSNVVYQVYSSEMVIMRVRHVKFKYISLQLRAMVKTPQELRMPSRSLADCKSLTLNVIRLGICQKIYRTEFSGERILHTENA